MSLAFPLRSKAALLAMLASRSRLARTEAAAHRSARSSSLAAPSRSCRMEQTHFMSSPAKNGLLATTSSLWGSTSAESVPAFRALNFREQSPQSVGTVHEVLAFSVVEHAEYTGFRQQLRDNGYGTLLVIAEIGLRVKATLKATGQATAREGREGWQGGAERDGGLRFAADAAGRKRDKEVGIPTTQYRAACRRWMAREQDGGERERRRASPVSRGIPRDRPEYDQGCNRGLFRRRQPGGTFEDAAIYAGLAPEDILVYVERGEGRKNRPPLKASTVAAKQAARRKAKQAASPRIDWKMGKLQDANTHHMDLV